MNILFMSLGEFSDLSSGSVHIDVVKELSKNNEVYLACKSEKNKQGEVGLTEEYGIHVLRVATGSIKTNNFIAKGISTITVEPQFKRAIKKHFKDVKFDLIIYTTPPITFVRPISYIKNRDHAKTYLMLKDIFPQNAVDLGMMQTGGAGGILYKFFRKKERALYRISDHIGCMSPANIAFVLDNNPDVSAEKMELFPNSIYVTDLSCSYEERIAIREKYGIPLYQKVFVYGGNLGKPQGIDFLIDCMRSVKDIDAFFLIVGGGTEYDKIKSYIEKEQPENVKLLKGLPKEDYDQLVAACDVGMLFLDHRFTIPNFPSRVLSYMQSRLPVVAVTDPNTDIGVIAQEGRFGWWCESNQTEGFCEIVKTALESDLKQMGDNAFDYLKRHYNVVDNCNKLLNDHGVKNR